VIAYLLENGAEVDKADDGGWTALHIAGARG
jgi:ankyrin repeat protein